MSATVYDLSEINHRFRNVVAEHQSRVFSIAFRILGERGIAEEVAQDVFLELYRSMEGIKSDEHLVAWLRRVAVHRATDAYRRRPRTIHNAVEFEDWMANGVKTEEASAMPSYVEKLLLSLPPIPRSVLILRYGEDMLPTEIAEALGMPLATVKSHLQRSLKCLRAKAGHGLKEGVRHG